MTFQNTTLLLALAAIGVPVALHLIARKEPKQVVFPSVLLLTQRFQTNRSKVRIRRWWLLALRIAALATIAFALSRPVIAGSLSLTWSTIGILSLVGIGLLALASIAANKPDQRTLVRGLLGVAGLALVGAIGWGAYTFASGKKPEIDESAPVALAIVIDNGPLSGWQFAEDSYLDRLKAASRELMTAVNRESRIALLDRSSTPAAFSLDLAGALSKVDGLQTLEVVGPLESRIEAAARLLQTSQIESRQIVILSSIPKSSFAEQTSTSAIQGLVEAAGIRVTLWDLGPLEGVNRQLSEPTLSDQSPAPDSTVSVAAIVNVSQTSEEAQADEKIQATAECVLFPSSASLPVVRDGKIVRPPAKPVDRVNVELTRGRDVEVRLTLPPLPVGLHHGAIRLAGEDSLAVDDAGYFSVEVLPASRLLLICDQDEEAEEIAWIVSAPAPIDDPASQYAIERIGYDDLASSTLSEFDGVMLLDPPESVFAEPELERYVASGGSVLVATGDALGQGEIELDQWLTFRRRWRVPQPGSFFEVSSTSHPALASINSLAEGVPFQDFRIQQYWQIDPEDTSRVLMRYAGTGHPALVELTAEEDSEAAPIGRRLVLTTPIPALAAPNRSWNDLLSLEDPWPAFVLVRDMTRYLTGRSVDSWTSNVGSPVSIPVRNETFEEGATRRLQWFPPVAVSPVPIDLPTYEGPLTKRAQRIAIGQPKRSGVHWIRGDQVGLGFTVNVPREKLTTDRIERSAVGELVGEDSFRVIESLEDMEWTATDGTRVVPLWSPIMLLALFAFLFEQVLGNRFYRNAHPTAAEASRSRAAA